MIVIDLIMATYNIRHGVSMAGNPDLEATADLIARIGPDIVSLQEVDHLRPRSSFVDQPSYLAAKLHMNYVFAPAVHYPVGSYGNALLSKYPVNSYVNHFLPSSAEKRSCLEADIIIGDQLVTVFNTHLDLSSQARENQVNELLLPLIKKRNHPVILSGDFNAQSNTEEIQTISKYLKDTFACNSGPLVNTYPADSPRVRIDYIFINARCRCRDFYIVESHASDHLPAVALVSI